MSQFFDKLLTGDAAWFGYPALVGTGLFVIRMILMSLGHHHDVEVHGDADIGDHGDHHSAHDFKVLSLQTIMAFAMGFGWGGILGKYTLHLEFGPSLGVGVLAGLLMVWVLAMLMRMMADLTSSGNISLEDSIGCEADVYVGIPPKGKGTGQVRVVVSERMRIINAKSDDVALPSQSRVRIIGINSDNTVTVAAS